MTAKFTNEMQSSLKALRLITLDSRENVKAALSGYLRSRATKKGIVVAEGSSP